MFRAILTFVLLSSLVILPQTTEDSSETLSRIKLSVGYLGGKYAEVGENSPFLNFNYRASQLLKYENAPQYGFAFEAGTN